MFLELAGKSILKVSVMRGNTETVKATADLQVAFKTCMIHK